MRPAKIRANMPKALIAQWIALLIALLIALCAVPAAQAAGSKAKEEPKDTAESVFNEGVEAMKEGEYADAAGSFEKALELKEGFAEAHNNLAYCLRKQGADHFDAALKHYNQAIELDPKLAQAYHYRGVLHALAGDEDAAKADHESLLELDRELADQLMKVIASGEEPEGHGGAVTAW